MSTPDPIASSEPAQATTDTGTMLLTVKEAAARLRVDERTVWRELERGALPRTKVRGRTLISRAALAAYIDRMTAAPVEVSQRASVRVRAPGASVAPLPVADAAERLRAMLAAGPPKRSKRSATWNARKRGRKSDRRTLTTQEKKS